MSQIIINGERKEAVLVKKAEIMGHDLTLLEGNSFNYPITSRYTTSRNTPA
jgi:hypothetical protein